MLVGALDVLGLDAAEAEDQTGGQKYPTKHHP